MALHCTDPGNGEVWSTDVNGAFYAPPISPGGNGDQFIQGLNQHPNYDAGSAESGGTNPCVGITPWKDATGAWGVCFITAPTNGQGSYGTPYHYYCFNRSGSAA